MAESTVVYTPDNGSQAAANSILPWMLAGNNGGFGSFNNIADLFGLAIIASMFGWGNGGFGGFGGFGGGAGAGFLSNQLNNDSGRELIMNAVTSQGEASRSAIQNLASALGQDFNLVNSAVQNVQNSLSSLAASQGMSTLQVINAIQAGNSSLAASLASCCCENRLLTTQQGYEAQIRTLEQTNQLGSQADRNTNAILGAINTQTIAINDGFCAIKERELQDKIDTLAAQNTVLRGQIDNSNQTAAITAYINGLVSPLAAKVSEIANKMPQTVPVTYPNITAVNNTPYGGYYGFGAGFNF